MDIGPALKALAEPTRFKIVQLLLERHHCARSLSRVLGISEPAVSQHMTVLRDAGVVTCFRHSRHLHYVLHEDLFRDIVDELGCWIERMPSIPDCHGHNPCQFKLGNGTCGCMYRKEHTREER